MRIATIAESIRRKSSVLGVSVLQGCREGSLNYPHFGNQKAIEK